MYPAFGQFLKKIIWALGLCAPAALIAQVRAITLPEMVEEARIHSAQIKAQDMESHALTYDQTHVGKWQNPLIIGQFGTLRSGPSEGATVELSVTQNVPLTAKYALRKELAGIALAHQTDQKKIFFNWIEHQVSLAAWKIKVNQLLYNHGVERSRRLTLIKNYLATHPRVSVKQQVDYSIISSNVLQLEKTQDEKAYELQIAEKDLEFWTAKKISAADFELTIPRVEQSYLPPEGEWASDPELLAAKKKLAGSSIELTIAKRERIPDLLVGGGYRHENVQPANRFGYGIIGFSLPLFDTGVSKLEAARARETRDQENLKDLERRVQLKHEKQRARLLFYRSQLKRFAPDLLAQQENSIQIAERGFKQGLIDVNTFLLAETQTHEVIDQIFIMWMEYLDGLSIYQLMNGQSFKWLN